VGIGTTTPQPAAVLDITSTSKGLLLPRLDEAQMRTMPNAVPGLLVFNTSANHFYGYRNATGVSTIAQTVTTSDVASNIQIGQSFTAPDNSILTSVAAYVSSSTNVSSQSDVVLRIYAGRGTGGALLGTATQYAILPPYTATPLMLDFNVLAQGISLVYGQEYTFTMQRNPISVLRFQVAGNLYPNGNFVPANVGNYDLQFQVFITKTGEWVPLD